MKSVLKSLKNFPLPVLKRLAHIAVFLLVSLFATHCSQALIFASSGLVSQIGGATFVQGANQFWVTSPRPAFSGVTSANVSVTGTVGTQNVSATADSSGNWSWTPAQDLSGDNPVSITSQSESVSFTLTIGDVPASVASASASTLAPAGTFAPTVAVSFVGVSLTLFGLWGFRRTLR
jgi:hypothetical protein